MNIKSEIEELIRKSLVDLDFEVPEKIVLDHPQDLKNGDYTTNIAMQLAGKEGKNPREIAAEILEKIGKIAKKQPTILFGYSRGLDFYINWERTSVAGNGYINFYLSKIFFRYYLESLTSNGTVDGVNDDFRNWFGGEIIYTDIKKQNILLEHSSPNLFKPFHIGHMVNNAIGESLVRILKYSGANVFTASFPSDVSPGIAKTIWALKKENISIGSLSLQEIADAYVSGSKEYKENDEVKKEVDKINHELYAYVNGSRENSKNIEFYEAGKKLSEEHFLEITGRLGSKFDKIFYESEAEQKGKVLVKKNINKKGLKVFEEVKNEDGTKSVIFKGTNFTNVFINSQGFGTYLAKDIGLLQMKKNKFPDIDKSLVVTDTEQKQHFEMVKEAGLQISEISDFVKKSEYLQHGRMTFSGNTKISSRYGNVPLAKELIRTVQKNIKEKMKERDFSKKDEKEISRKLAIATLKYSILKVTSGKNISFDMEKDLNPQGNTAIFLLYTYVRTKSIFEKNDIKLESITFSEDDRKGEIPDVEKLLYKFNEIVTKSIEDFSPHHLANYLYDLAKKFNSYYEKNNFSDKSSDNFNYNFALLKVFGKTMETGLDLLGIETVEKM